MSDLLQNIPDAPRCWHRAGTCLGLALAIGLPNAHAHVTLTPTEVALAQRHELELTVPHGCKGSPTVRLRVRIPEGVLDVRATDKPDWTVETVEGSYRRPYAMETGHASEGVLELLWRGGPLLDGEDAEFVFSAFFSADLPAGIRLHFPVVQECLRGTERWIDIPAEGSRPAEDHSDAPAPGLRLLPPR